MTDFGILIDVQYAIRQLREFSDIGRALDALDRVEATLAERNEAALADGLFDADDEITIVRIAD